MRKAEQILKHYLNHLDIETKATVLVAMEVYADQFKQAPQSKAVSITEAEKEHYNIKNVSPKGCFPVIY